MAEKVSAGGPSPWLGLVLGRKVACLCKPNARRLGAGEGNELSLRPCPWLGPESFLWSLSRYIVWMRKLAQGWFTLCRVPAEL